MSDRYTSRVSWGHGAQGGMGDFEGLELGRTVDVIITKWFLWAKRTGRFQGCPSQEADGVLSTRPWRSTTMCCGRRSRPCRPSWCGGAGPCAHTRTCASWTLPPAWLQGPLAAGARRSGPQTPCSTDNMAARSLWACSRPQSPLPRLTGSLQICSLTVRLASPCPLCPLCPLALPRSLHLLPSHPPALSSQPHPLAPAFQGLLLSSTPYCPAPQPYAALYNPL